MMSISSMREYNFLPSHIKDLSFRLSNFCSKYGNFFYLNYLRNGQLPSVSRVTSHNTAWNIRYRRAVAVTAEISWKYVMLWNNKKLKILKWKISFEEFLLPFFEQ